MPPGAERIQPRFLPCTAELCEMAMRPRDFLSACADQTCDVIFGPLDLEADSLRPLGAGGQCRRQPAEAGQCTRLGQKLIMLGGSDARGQPGFEEPHWHGMEEQRGSRIRRDVIASC